MTHDWDEYAIYIIKALERQEIKIDALDKSLREHMEQEENRIGIVEALAAQTARDVKWHARIASAIGAATGAALAIVISLFKE